jgi:hypothetical protein
MTGRSVPPQAPAVTRDSDRRPGTRAEPGESAVRRPSSAYLRSPVFWAMVISAPILWGLAILLTARIFHAAIS